MINKENRITGENYTSSRTDREPTIRRGKFERGPAGGLIALRESVSYDASKTPTIVWIPSSCDFVNPNQAVTTLQQAGMKIDNLTAFNTGLQASFLAKSGDILILQNSAENEEIAKTAVRRTSELWERQTGISPMTPETGSVVLTQNMLYEVSSQSMLRMDAGLRVPQVIREVEEGTDGLSTGFVEYWNDKNRAVPHLQNHAVPVAQTHVFERYDPITLKRTLGAYPVQQHFVLKISGSAGGVGVYTNENKGLREQETLEVARTIDGPFQVQEFIPGDDYGVVGFIDDKGRISIMSQHKQRIHNGEFYGAIVTPDIANDAEITELAQQGFEAQYAHSKEYGVRAIGATGFDIRKAAYAKPKIIESNMRETGAIGALYVRELLATNPGFKSTVEDHLGKPVERITTNTNISIPHEVFTDPEFIDKALALAKKHSVVILTQGFNVHHYNSNTKMIFLNDTQHHGSPLGETERAFMQTVDAMYENKTGKPGPNRDSYEIKNH